MWAETMDKTAQILFQYLKEILYHPEQAELDIETLPEDFKKLGMGLQLLAEWIRESNDFSKAMVKGELSKEPPGGENVLAAPMKALQGSLRHLTWQTQQVAKGDFSQRVDFMGEFSEAFNTMTKQLAERTQSLIKEKQLVDSMNLELKKNLELMLALTNYTHNMIYVISSKERKKIFQNRSAEWFEKTRCKEAGVLWEKLSKREFVKDSESENWEIDLAADGKEEVIYYSVESFKIQWAGTPAIVHIVIDNTQRKKQENLIYSMAYVDSLTGLNNRRYAVEKMESLRNAGKDFVFTIIDVDNLKYCNDIYGHETGDHYLKNVADLLKTMHGGDVCRIGGDEFYILEEGTDLERHDRELDHLRTFFMEQKDYPYPHSFSFASNVVLAEMDKPLEQHIRETDRRMYEYKRKNRKHIEDIQYQDDRLPCHKK